MAPNPSLLPLKRGGTTVFSNLGPLLQAVMALQMYSLAVLTWDTCRLVLLLLFAFLEALWRLVCPPRPRSVRHEIVLIVGAARGVGRQLALQLGALGARVVCVDIDSICNRATAFDICQNGGRAFAYQLDVTNRDMVFATAARIKKDVGCVCTMINCSSMPSRNSLVQRSSSDISSILERSAISQFWVLQAFLPQMKELQRGHVVMLSSVAGLSGMNDQLPWTASQFAVKGLAESLRQELRTSQWSKIQVTLVQIYPLLVNPEVSKDMKFRIPSYFGTLDPKEASRQIVVGVRRGYAEISIPGYLLFLSNLLRLLPRDISLSLRELLDTGVAFG